MDQNQEKIDPTLVGIASAVSRIDQSVKDLRRELIGNGQPGRLPKLEDDVKALNKKYWSITGGIVVASHGLRYFLAKLGII
jgi:hypothetical protein